jgi:hypothetical protein
MLESSAKNAKLPKKAKIPMVNNPVYAVRQPYLFTEDDEERPETDIKPVVHPYKVREKDDPRSKGVNSLFGRVDWQGDCEAYRCSGGSAGAVKCPDGIEREFCEWHMTYEI